MLLTFEFNIQHTYNRDDDANTRCLRALQLALFVHIAARSERRIATQWSPNRACHKRVAGDTTTRDIIRRTLTRQLALSSRLVDERRARRMINIMRITVWIVLSFACQHSTWPLLFTRQHTNNILSFPIIQFAHTQTHQVVEGIEKGDRHDRDRIYSLYPLPRLPAAGMKMHISAYILYISICTAPAYLRVRLSNAPPRCQRGAYK